MIFEHMEIYRKFYCSYAVYIKTESMRCTVAVQERGYGSMSLL